MYTRQLLIGVLATLLTLGLFGTAFASDFDSSEAGSWHYSFNAPITDADRAAMNHDYDLTALTEVGTEKGITDHQLETPMADEAAMNHVYDKNRLAEIGTEAGIRDAVLCSQC